MRKYHVFPVIAVQAVLAEASDKSDSSSGSNSRGPYLHLTSALKFNIGKRASEYGVTSTLRYYKEASTKGNLGTKV